MGQRLVSVVTSLQRSSEQNTWRGELPGLVAQGRRQLAARQQLVCKREHARCDITLHGRFGQPIPHICVGYRSPQYWQRLTPASACAVTPLRPPKQLPTVSLATERESAAAAPCGVFRSGRCMNNAASIVLACTPAAALQTQNSDNLTRCSSPSSSRCAVPPADHRFSHAAYAGPEAFG